MDTKCLMIFAILNSNFLLSLLKSTEGISCCYVSRALQKRGNEF